MESPDNTPFLPGQIWRKRVAPITFELRRIEQVSSGRIITSSHVDQGRTFYAHEFVDLYAPLVDDERTIVLAGSGHRPEHIVTGKYTVDEVRDKIYNFYVDLLKWIRVKEVISGLARGFDMWLARAALESDTRLVGAIPHPEQTRGWPEESKDEWQTIVENCSEVEVVSPAYWAKEGDNALYARNRWMVDRSTHLTSFWQGTKGGTAWTNDYAVARGKPRLVINGVW